MPLGPQFSNTYWEDPTSKSVKSSTELPTPEGALPTATQRTPQIAEGFGTSATPQGMLFSPHAYTGLKDDPTVPAGHRMSVIHKSLHLKGMEELQNKKDARTQKNKEIDAYNSSHERVEARKPYRKNLPNYGDIHTMYKKNEALATSANNLDIPTHEYEKDVDIPTSAVEYYSGWASGNRTAISVGVGRTKTRVVSEVSTPAPSTVSIPNTGFWKQYKQKVQHPYNIHSILDEDSVHWQNDKGHVIQGNPSNYIKNAEGQGGFEPSESDAMSWLKENNYHPNVYPTKGESGKKHVVGERIAIESGPHTIVGGEYTYQSWHTRYAPDTTKEPKITQSSKVVQGPYVANTSTLAHELGHTKETRRDSPEREHLSKGRSGIDLAIMDPVSEGYADALADRAHRYSGQFEKHLTNTKVRANDIATTGYTSTFGRWNADERALYSAVRFHLAAHPERTGEMQNRKDMENSMLDWGKSTGGYTREPTTKLMLGHMYEHMPHVRPVLHELGFGKTSKTAHEFYNSRVPDLRYSGRGKKREVYEQPNLPGM